MIEMPSLLLIRHIFPFSVGYGSRSIETGKMSKFYKDLVSKHFASGWGSFTGEAFGFKPHEVFYCWGTCFVAMLAES